MLEANVISEHLNWKRVIKNPSNYLKNRLKKLSRAPFFKNKKSGILNTFN